MIKEVSPAEDKENLEKIKNERKLLAREQFVLHLRDPSTFDFNYESLRKSVSRSNITLYDSKRAILKREIKRLLRDEGTNNMKRLYSRCCKDQHSSVRIPGYRVYNKKKYVNGEQCIKRNYKRMKEGDVDNYDSYIETPNDVEKLLVDKILSLTKKLEELKREETSFGDEELFNEFFDWFSSASEEMTSKCIIIYTRTPLQLTTFRIITFTSAETTPTRRTRFIKL